MPVYVVAEMHYDRVIRSKEVQANSPDSAASEMNACKTVFKRWAKDWFRVTDEVGKNSRTLSPGERILLKRPTRTLRICS